MSARRINPRLIRLHRPYSVEDVARVLSVHKQSVRNWIKGGLPIVDRTRPVLMHGHELRAFLEGKRKAARRPCSPGTIYCFKCRQPRAPAIGMVEYTPKNATTGDLSALCGTCSTIMHRAARLASLAAIMPNLNVQIREAWPRIIERTPPSLNYHKHKD